MHRSLLTLALVLALLPAVAGVTAAAADPVNIYLVRHAERAPGDEDPALSEAGEARAAQLAFVLADAGIELILSTDYRRTKETAATVARELGLPVELYDARDLPALATMLQQRQVCALVVGHSNTTTAAVAALGGDPGTDIDDATEFDRLYVVTTDFDQVVHSALLHYGAR